jgi:hypothetical protein
MKAMYPEYLVSKEGKWNKNGPQRSVICECRLVPSGIGCGLVARSCGRGRKGISSGAVRMSVSDVCFRFV